MTNLLQHPDLDASKALALIADHNLLWAAIFYQKAILRQNLQIHLLPQYPDMTFLNSASLLPDKAALARVEECFKEQRLRPSVWLDPYSGITSKALTESNYSPVAEEVEIWQGLNLQRELPKPENLLHVPSTDLSLRCRDPKEDPAAWSSFLKFSLPLNGVAALQEFMQQKLHDSILGSRQFRIFSLHHEQRYLSVICLGIKGHHAFAYLAATAESHRGLGLWPYLRMIAAHEAQSLGAQILVSQTVTGNTAAMRGSARTGSRVLFERRLWIKNID